MAQNRSIESIQRTLSILQSVPTGAVCGTCLLTCLSHEAEAAKGFPWSLPPNLPAGCSSSPDATQNADDAVWARWVSLMAGASMGYAAAAVAAASKELNGQMWRWTDVED